MKKIGFTLAEVLVAMSIIGVISAMTIPTFMSGVHNKAHAAKLSAAVSEYENIFGMMLLRENQVDLSDTELGAAISSDNATAINQAYSRYSKISSNSTTFSGMQYTASAPYSNAAYAAGEVMKDISGNAVTNFTFISAIKSNSGSIIFFTGGADNSLTEAQAVTAGAGSNTKASGIYIDVNGAEAPNQYGRDVYAFVLGGNGTLYPYGSVTASFLNKVANNPVWTDNNATYGCSTGTYNGLGCTARLIEKNYKMDY